MVGGKQPIILFKIAMRNPCQRTLNQLLLRQCHSVIKSVWFQHSKFSKVAKMIYNSISDACSVVSVPKLAIESLEFDQNSIQTWQNNFISSIMADVDMLTSLWFLARLRSRIQMASEIAEVQNDVFFNV